MSGWISIPQLALSNWIKALGKHVDKVINNNKDKINEYHKGKTKLFGYFIGEAMKESEGKANPKILNEVLSNKLLSN